MYNKNVKLIKNKKYRKTLMTTVIGVKCVDGFVIGSDSQLSIGTRNKEVGYDKIYQIGRTLIAFSGDADYFERIRDEVESRLDVGISNFNELKDIFQDCMKNLYNNFPITDENYTEIIFGTAINNRVVFYRINSHDCFAIEIKKYYPIGTGSVFAKYILKRLWNDNLKCIGAGSILAHVIFETTTVDQNSNSPINVAEIRNNGFIYFCGRDFIDRIIIAISRADKHFNSLFYRFITNPKSLRFTKDGVIVKNGK